MDAGMFVEPVCEDPNLGTGRFGNFACAPARPTCLLTTRPRACAGDNPVMGFKMSWYDSNQLGCSQFLEVLIAFWCTQSEGSRQAAVKAH